MPSMTSSATSAVVATRRMAEYPVACRDAPSQRGTAMAGERRRPAALPGLVVSGAAMAFDRIVVPHKLGEMDLGPPQISAESWASAESQDFAELRVLAGSRDFAESPGSAASHDSAESRVMGESLDSAESRGSAASHDSAESRVMGESLDSAESQGSAESQD